MTRLATAPHEFDANLIYDEYGLQPFFALDSIIKNHDGGPVRRRFTVDGEEFQAKLYYQNSGLKPRDDPSFEIETVREFRVKWQAVDDPEGQRSGTLHVAPRWPDMETTSGKTPSVPGDLEGVNVRVQGSNVEFDQYPALVRRCLDALGVRADYFRKIHRYSNVQDAERYVRITRDEAGRLHATDGIISRVAHLLPGDRDGYRKHVADDRKEVGYYHTATVGAKRAGELVPGHTLPKEVKCYLPREPDAFSPDDALYHPKLGVSYQRSIDDSAVKFRGTGDTLDQLTQELDELLLNCLQWAGFPTKAATLADADDDHASGREVGPYVEDAYWRVRDDPGDVTLVVDPTPKLKDRQENIVIKHLTDGLADSDWATLDTLVTDGGELSPADVADDTDYHLNTIYAALDRLDDLVEHNYGEITLRSTYIAEQVTTAVQHAQDAFKDAATTAANAIETAGANIENSALVEWMHAHGVDVDDRRDGQLLLRFGRLDPRENIREILENGLTAWRAAGRDLRRFKHAKVEYQQNGQSHARVRALD